MDSQKEINQMEASNQDRHLPGRWWVSKDHEVLIQIVSDDDLRIETVYPINFKYWTGPKTNHVEGSSVEEFDSTWIFKSL
tara:strand:- start:2231 stop:2470 length:240 start_codon:yes stop_codon:yes gene_type:complete